MGEFKRAQLLILKRNFRTLLAVKTEPYTAARFKKKRRLKELNIKIKKLERELVEC